MVLKLRTGYYCCRGTTKAVFGGGGGRWELQAPFITWIYHSFEAFDLTASVHHTYVNTYGSGNTYPKLSA